MTTARPPAIARAKATTASTQDPRPLSDRGHHPVLRFLNVPGGIRLHRGPIRGGVVGRVRFFPGLGTSIAQDPDELVFLIDRPGADDLEAMAPPEWGDQPRPLVKPGPHFARLDGVDAELVGQRLLAAFEDDDRNLAARQLLELGLIDEIDLHIAPILLGEGIRLYDNPGSEPIRLHLVGQGDPTSAVNVRYRPLLRT